MKKSLPTGKDFLPGINEDDLKKRYKKEKDPKAKERLLAYMARKRGDSLRTIAKNLCKSFSVIRVWLYRVIDGGLDNIYDIKRPGPARRLTEEQLTALKADLIAGPQKHGFESSMWTGKLVVEHVRRKYHIEFVPRTMQELLHEMGFRHVKPRPRHPKAASEEDKAEFKKKAQEIVEHYRSKGYKIFAGDEASHILGWNLQRGWYHKDEPAIAPVTLSRKRFHTIGALSEDQFYCRFYDKVNTQSFADFLVRMYIEYGPFVIFLDNASYHKSKILKGFLEGMDKRIVVEYFLTYTPELNPSEGQWKSIRKATGNRLYETTDDMKASIRKMLVKGEIIPVKMYDYLTG